MKNKFRCQTCDLLKTTRGARYYAWTARSDDYFGLCCLVCVRKMRKHSIDSITGFHKAKKQGVIK